MAKLKGIFPFVGTLGGVNAYKENGSDDTILRMPGGPSGKKVKTDPAFELTRQNNMEFTGASMAAKAVTDSMYCVRNVVSGKTHGKLTGICKKLRLEDKTGARGQRSFYFSRKKQLLEGFSINENIQFETIVMQPIGYTIDREAGSATIHLPELIPGLSLNARWDYPVFEFTIQLGILPDLEYKNGEYKFLYDPNDSYGHPSVYHKTGWLPRAVAYPGENIVLTLPEGSVTGETCNLNLSIAIGFGKLLTNTLVKPVKYAAAGKILAIG